MTPVGADLVVRRAALGALAGSVAMVSHRVSEDTSKKYLAKLEGGGSPDGPRCTRRHATVVPSLVREEAKP